MTTMFRTIAPAGTIPARSLTIHKADTLAVSFDGYGTATIDGPKRAELACMVSALPMVLRAVVRVAGILRDRDGKASPLVDELEAALAEAGINPDAPTEEAQPMTPITPSTTAERYAFLLVTIADKLDAILADKKGLHSTPMPIRDTMAEISDSIRRTVKENRPTEF